MGRGAYPTPVPSWGVGGRGHRLCTQYETIVSVYHWTACGLGAGAGLSIMLRAAEAVCLALCCMADLQQSVLVTDRPAAPDGADPGFKK
jgi:hypothetical protein